MTLAIDTLGFIGGGQMAEAIIRGVLAARLLPSEKIFVAEPDQTRRRDLQNRYRICCESGAEDLCRKCPVLVLAIKPQIAGRVMGEYRPFVTGGHLVISIMAGLSLAKLDDLFTETPRLIRVMPNMPALQLAGATAFSAGSRATTEDCQIASTIFSAVGLCVEVDERQLDAVTGLSGSGPGYVFTFIEALVDAGVLAGLPRATAEQLALQTVYGSARLALTSKEPASVLRAKVTSPGGTTISGLQALENGAFRGLIMEAVMAATRRSRELGS